VSGVQVWLVKTLASVPPVRSIMHSHWGWPAAETIHFFGLSLLVGTIVLFDLRLLGLAKRIPVAALHRLIPWGLLGFAINATTGAAFLMTEPDQYIYNPAFHLKMLFIVTAGVNALAFYLTSYRRATAAGALEVPRPARAIALVSLCLWIAVIVCGRLLTFYRPWPCGPEGPGFLATCIPTGR
jgi:hypothetical protein